MTINYNLLYSDRIGGSNFGAPGQVFKFTQVEEAKARFITQNPLTEILDFGVGEPEERAPDFVLTALSEAAKRKENRLYPNNGGPQFKAAASSYLKRAFEISANPDSEIVHCIGTKTALIQAPLAFLNPGDTLITTKPGYPVLPKMARWLGANVIELPLAQKNNFLPDLQEMEEALQEMRAKIIHLNYPNNPTGAVAPLAFFEKVVSLANKYNAIVINDAAYADLQFHGTFASPLMVAGGKECSLEFYSLSKSYNMQGFRIGFAVGAAPLVKAFALAKDNTDNGQFLAIQEAAAFALENGSAFLESQKQKYNARLLGISAVLRDFGFQANPSGGAFYLYVPILNNCLGECFESAAEAATFLLHSSGIVTVPWDDVEPSLRFSMTFSLSNSLPNELAVYQELRKRLLSLSQK